MRLFGKFVWRDTHPQGKQALLSWATQWPLASGQTTPQIKWTDPLDSTCECPLCAHRAGESGHGARWGQCWWSWTRLSGIMWNENSFLAGWFQKVPSPIFIWSVLWNSEQQRVSVLHKDSRRVNWPVPEVTVGKWISSVVELFREA